MGVPMDGTFDKFTAPLSLDLAKLDTRLQYGIGTGIWGDTDTVADEATGVVLQSSSPPIVLELSSEKGRFQNDCVNTEEKFV